MTLRDRVADILESADINSQLDMETYQEWVELKNKLDEIIEETKDKKENDYLASEWGLTL